MEYGVMPVLEINGKKYSQLRSILRFLGKKYGYYPADPESQYEVDSVMDAAADVFAYGGMHIHKKFVDQDPNWQKEVPDCYKLHETFYERMQKRLEKKPVKTFLVGDKLTIADFFVFSMMRCQVHSEVMEPFFKGIHDKSPLMKEFYEDKLKNWSDIIAKAGTYPF